MDRRTHVFAVIIWICFTVLLGRLWVLQIIHGTVNYRSSQKVAIDNISIPAPRGVFYDRHGRLLVGNTATFSIMASKYAVGENPEVINRLARILNCTADSLNQRLNSAEIRPYQLYPLAKNVPVKTAMLLQESLDLPGIEVEKIPSRRYIYGDFATHAFGYIGEINNGEYNKFKSSGYQLGDMIGKIGLERSLELFLRGESGVRRMERDWLQRPVGQVDYRSPEPGYDAFLTLDFNVQKAAEEALRNKLSYLQKYTKYRNAKAGAVIALDPRNGEILAMTSQPSFDPNLFIGIMPSQTFAALNTNPNKPFNNRVLRGVYPPASTFKPFTVLAALSAGKVGADETFYCTGYDRVFGNKAKCWIASQGRGHGRLDLIGGLKNSCNVVMYELGRRLGVERLAAFARLFHFGRSIGIDLSPGDATGIVPDKAYKKKVNPKDDWRDLETLHFAIGQGYLEVTPLQLAMAYGGLANGGKFYQPHLVKSIRDMDRRLIRNYQKPQLINSIAISAENKRLILEGLNEVVSGGTASGAFSGFPLQLYPIAGKTGTSQKTGYDDFALFACFAPADRPTIVVVVVIEQGGGGSIAAAPVARQVLEAYFGLTPARQLATVKPHNTVVDTENTPQDNQDVNTQTTSEPLNTQPSEPSIDSQPQIMQEESNSQ